MTDNKFHARFKRRIGGESWEYKDVLVSYELLKERGKLKPPNTFTFEKQDYIFVKDIVRDKDKNGRAIITYYEGNPMPLFEPPLKNVEFLVKDYLEEDNGEIKLQDAYKNIEKEFSVKDAIGNWIRMSARVLNETFKRGEMKNIIASSQKEPQKWDWMTMVIGVCLGVAVGVIIGILIYPQFIHQATSSTAMIDYAKSLGH